MTCEKQFALPALVAIPRPLEELGNLRIQWGGCNRERLSKLRFCPQKSQSSRELQAVESVLNVEKALPESIPLTLLERMWCHKRVTSASVTKEGHVLVT